MNKKLRLIAITDRHLTGGLNELLTAAEELLHGGLPCLMLREKDLPGGVLFETAKALRRITSAHQALLIVNDRVDVALAAGADGAHLGANSIPLEAARRIVPAGFLLGVSCHDRAELLAAAGGGADYAFLSPVYTPISKEAAAEPLGVAGFFKARQGIQLPVIALGGVRADDVTALLNSGASGVASIGELFGETDRASAARAFLTAVDEFY